MTHIIEIPKNLQITSANTNSYSGSELQNDIHWFNIQLE